MSESSAADNRTNPDEVVPPRDLSALPGPAEYSLIATALDREYAKINPEVGDIGTQLHEFGLKFTPMHSDIVKQLPELTTNEFLQYVANYKNVLHLHPRFKAYCLQRFEAGKTWGPNMSKLKRFEHYTQFNELWSSFRPSYDDAMQYIESFILTETFDEFEFAVR